MRLQIIGYLATDSDGTQYLHQKLPTKRLIHRKENKVNDMVVAEEMGEWKTKGHFRKDLGIAKILIGIKVVNHTWKDEPVKYNILLEPANG